MISPPYYYYNICVSLVTLCDIFYFSSSPSSGLLGRGNKSSVAAMNNNVPNQKTIAEMITRDSKAVVEMMSITVIKPPIKRCKKIDKEE